MYNLRTYVYIPRNDCTGKYRNLVFRCMSPWIESVHVDINRLSYVYLEVFHVLELHSKMLVKYLFKIILNSIYFRRFFLGSIEYILALWYFSVLEIDLFCIAMVSCSSDENKMIEFSSFYSLLKHFIKKPSNFRIS